MTFFGHSSATGFDQSIDNPANYYNIGKYPLLVANGCLIGNIHRPFSAGQSGSENWVLVPGAPNKGAIGFIGTIDLSLPGELFTYTDNFFYNLSTLNYGQSLGKCMNEAVIASQGNLSDIYMNSVCLEMTLHGDPSIVINSHKYPDYAIADSSIYFTPNIVSVGTDSFDVNIVVTNIGKATYDTLSIELKRIFPNGSSVVYDTTRANIFYRDTITFRLPVDDILGPGLNKFEITLDPTNVIAEEMPNGENNNSVVIPPATLFIYSGDIIPVYPYKYAIVPNNTVKLKASTGNPFAPPTNYRFEVDTTDMFISPIASTVINAPGGVVTCNLPLTLTDSTVYIFDAGGKITGDQHYESLSGLPFQLSFKQEYTYSAVGTSVVNLQQSSYDPVAGTYDLVSTFDLTYDSKTNPLRLNSGNEAIVLSRPSLFSGNNATKAIVTNTVSPANDFTMDYTYKYNSANKPDSSYGTRTPGGAVTATKYFYQ